MGKHASKLTQEKTGAVANRFAGNTSPKTAAAQVAAVAASCSNTVALQDKTALQLENRVNDKREPRLMNADVPPAPFLAQVAQRQKAVGPYITNHNPTNLREDNFLHSILAALESDHGVSVIPKGGRESFFGTPFKAKEHSWVTTMHGNQQQTGWIEDGKLTRVEPVDQNEGKSQGGASSFVLSSPKEPPMLELVTDLKPMILIQRTNPLRTHEDHGESDEDRNRKIEEFNNALKELQKYASSPEGRLPTPINNNNNNNNNAPDVGNGGTISSYSRAGEPVKEALLASARAKGYELANKTVNELLMRVIGLSHSLDYEPMRVLN